MVEYSTKPHPHQFAVDRFGWVTAQSADGGILKDQSVIALLLLAILLELEKKP